MNDRQLEHPNITAIERNGYPQEPSVTPMFSGDLYETVEVSDEEYVEMKRSMKL